MKTNEIRSAFLDFFEQRGHRVVPSSSLVPANDPTLLFTNSGMVQFKDALTGRERLDYRRAVSCQRCVRAGGKHNDLENVGYTARHQTLFEMLGNFSFGDYFKEDAITWAWEFVTGVLALSENRIWVTVHPTDHEAREIWIRRIGLSPERVIDHEDNFWAMGDTGPCGPDSELFYDLGPDVTGGPPGSPDEDGDRFSEFWNLVFPQFDRAADGTLTPLATPGVDTGMGLERVAAIVQGVKSSYENDLLRRLVVRAGRFARMRDEGAMLANPSLRVIADHVRTATFLIGDGVLPGNEDRAYVLRRIIRRALRHGHKLDIREPFFHRMVGDVVELMGDAYPGIVAGADGITEALADEERRFAATLRSGMVLLDGAIAKLGDSTIPGDIVFKLYDTYGFPPDLTADVARERGLAVDQAGFDRAMEAQRERGRAAASRFSASLEQSIRVDSKVAFSGYSQHEGQASVVGLFEDGVEVATLGRGATGIVLLDETPFYAEAGGQVGDRGVIGSRDGGVRFEVDDTTRGGDQHLHHGRLVAGTLRSGDHVVAAIDGERRGETVLNHSATHLLHAALREVLGSHVEQRGSLVAPDRLRFDFSHPKPVTACELQRIEALVNDRIRDNTETGIEVMDFDDALAKGAIALFGEKYADRVRVLTMGNGFSVELCGGTHVARSGDIGVFHIVSEEGVAAGVRRVEAVTGAHALAWFTDSERRLETVAAVVRGTRSDVDAKVRQLASRARDLQREVEELNAKLAAGRGADLAHGAVEVNGIQVLAARVDGDPKSLPATMDSLRDRLGDAVVVLGHVGAKVSLIAGVSKSVSSRVKASDAVRFVAERVGARGGGRPEMAQAGGGDRPDQLNAALEAVADWVRERTGSS
ncbi:MAG: alanine--tRNA ligase [Gammaproteobacteria bacterium]|nr:alanine--tRNA ligase [Gammaproteobacteria bacterium]